MMSAARMFFFLMFQVVFLQETAGAIPVIVAHPSEINLGLSDTLAINCSFTDDGSTNMAAMISLIVSRANDSSQTFEELAGITAFSPNTVNQISSEGFTAEGVFNQAGESFLYLTWQQPSESQAGLYQCILHGVDALGHNLVMDSMVQIIVDETNLGDVMASVKEMRQEMANMANYTRSLEQKIAVMDSHTERLELLVNGTETCCTATERLKQQVVNLEDMVARLDNYTKYLEGKVDHFLTKDLLEEFDFALTYNHHTYFLSKGDYQDSNESISACQDKGAYLVEIDDSEEYYAIQSFLNTTTSFHFLLISGSDEASEGNWIFPRTNTSMPFLDWLPGAPDGGRSYSCIYLFPPDWMMGDNGCHYPSAVSDTRFLCEWPFNYHNYL